MSLARCSEPKLANNKHIFFLARLLATYEVKTGFPACVSTKYRLGRYPLSTHQLLYLTVLSHFSTSRVALITHDLAV